jgi:hypothetical protein
MARLSVGGLAAKHPPTTSSRVLRPCRESVDKTRISQASSLSKKIVRNGTVCGFVVF